MEINSPRLRCWPSWWKQWAQEEVIPGILSAIAVQVFPPAAAEIPWLPGSELGLAVLQQLESPVHGKRILDHERVVIESLTGYVHGPRSAIAKSCGRHGVRWRSR